MERSNVGEVDPGTARLAIDDALALRGRPRGAERIATRSHLAVVVVAARALLLRGTTAQMHWRFARRWLDGRSARVAHAPGARCRRRFRGDGRGGTIVARDRPPVRAATFRCRPKLGLSSRAQWRAARHRRRRARSSRRLARAARRQATRRHRPSRSRSPRASALDARELDPNAASSSPSVAPSPRAMTTSPLRTPVIASSPSLAARRAIRRRSPWRARCRRSERATRSSRSPSRASPSSAPSMPLR